VSESSPSDVCIVTVKLKRYKWAWSLSNLEELIQAEGDKLGSEILEVINYIWNEEKLPPQWKECIIIPLHRKGHKSICL
jgi:hypothetical protein